MFDLLRWGEVIPPAHAIGNERQPPFLTDCGAQVQMAVCAGRADITDAPLERPFAARFDVLSDFVADPDSPLPFTYAGPSVGVAVDARCSLESLVRALDG